jgi:hypothetical protein
MEPPDNSRFVNQTLRVFERDNLEVNRKRPLGSLKRRDQHGIDTADTSKEGMPIL